MAIFHNCMNKCKQLTKTQPKHENVTITTFSNISFNAFINL